MAAEENKSSSSKSSTQRNRRGSVGQETADEREERLARLVAGLAQQRRTGVASPMSYPVTFTVRDTDQPHPRNADKKRAPKKQTRGPIVEEVKDDD